MEFGRAVRNVRRRRGFGRLEFHVDLEVRLCHKPDGNDCIPLALAVRGMKE